MSTTGVSVVENLDKIRKSYPDSLRVRDIKKIFSCHNKSCFTNYRFEHVYNYGVKNFILFHCLPSFKIKACHFVGKPTWDEITFMIHHFESSIARFEVPEADMIPFFQPVTPKNIFPICEKYSGLICVRETTPKGVSWKIKVSVGGDKMELFCLRSHGDTHWNEIASIVNKKLRLLSSELIESRNAFPAEFCKWASSIGLQPEKYREVASKLSDRDRIKFGLSNSWALIIHK